MSDCRYVSDSSLIPAWSHTFVENNLEIISTGILLPLVDLRRVVVSNKGNNVHEILVNY